MVSEISQTLASDTAVAGGADKMHKYCTSSQHEDDWLRGVHAGRRPLPHGPLHHHLAQGFQGPGPGLS